MAKTKINPKAIDWDEIPTGTIVSGANLGLDSTDNIIKASVSGGGSSTDTQNITLVGSAYAYNNYTHRYTVHENGSSTSTLGTKWTEYKSGWGGPTSTSVSTTGIEALANWACWIAPEDCTLKNFYGAYTSDNGSIDVYISLWQATPSNQATSVTWTRRAFVTRSGGSVTSGGLTPVSSTGMSVSVTAGDLFAVAVSGETGSDSGALGNVFFTAAIKIEI